MSQYYQVSKSKVLYKPKAKEAFKISRSKIDLFLKCPRCFYLDRRLGVSQPSGFPFNLNSAVDHLLKKEFDWHRAKNKVHPLVKSYGLNLAPFKHKEMENWRNNFQGVRYWHQPTNFLVFGAIDDLWIDKQSRLYVVDYKATSKDSEISIDADWQIGYKRQMEIYQWLLRRNGFQVSDIGYFVYCNGRRDKEAFDAKLEFDVQIIPYQGDDQWVENCLMNILKCLKSNKMPAANSKCEFCDYFETRKKYV